MFFPSQMGTPTVGTHDVPDLGGDSGRGGGGGTSESRKSINEFVGHNHSWSSAPNPAWGGYSVPNFGMVKMRQGGPTIGGPGFRNDGESDSGNYDLGRKSPGIGFKSRESWRVWACALELMQKGKILHPKQVLHHAMAMARVPRDRIDQSEIRLLEMGIEWYLSDPGSLGAKRGAGLGGQGASPTISGGFMRGSGAPAGSM